MINNNIKMIKKKAKVNQSLDEDLLQHLVLKTIDTAVPNYDPDSNNTFNTYLYYVLESRKNSYLKKGKDILKESLSLDFEYNNDDDKSKSIQPKSNKNVENTILNQSVVNYLKDILDNEQMFVLKYYYYKGYTYREISKMLDITYQGVGYKMKQIRKIIKNNINYI